MRALKIGIQAVRIDGAVGKRGNAVEIVDGLFAVHDAQKSVGRVGQF